MPTQGVRVEQPMTLNEGLERSKLEGIAQPDLSFDIILLCQQNEISAKVPQSLRNSQRSMSISCR